MELNWQNAEAWATMANIETEYPDPVWRWDCGFKLDFDGALIRVSSRFYPPHKNDGVNWAGDCDIMFLDKKIASKEFINIDLDSLKTEVLIYVEECKSKIEKLISNLQ